MIDAVLKFFRERIRSDPAEPEAAREHRLQLATAALLIEMSRADFTVKEEERRAILHALGTAFSLGPTETQELVRLAEEQARESISIYSFTRLIDQELSRTDKIEVVELLWRIAWADHEIEKHEEQFVRKVADLLHVEHADFIAAKLRARGTA